MKKLTEALKAIDSNISESTLKTIEDLFESAVATQASAKIDEMVSVVDQYMGTISESVKNSIVEEHKTNLDTQIELTCESLNTKYDAYIEEKMDTLSESLDKYITHAATEFIEENKVAIVDTAVVESANNVMATVSESFATLGLSLEDITESKGKDNKETNNALVDKNIALKKELTETKNRITMAEALADVDVLVASKATALLEPELNVDSASFREKCEVVVALVESGKTNKTPAKTIVETKTARKPSWVK